MTLLQIQYVLTCARTNSFAKAAAEMYTSASNLSKMIKSLEEELGFPLFIRQKNGVIPTDEGTQFLLHANKILAEFQAIDNIQAQEKEPGSLVITQLYNPYCVLAFNDLLNSPDSKGIQYKLITCNQLECIERLKKGQSDISITCIPTAFKSEYTDILDMQNLVYQELDHLDSGINLREGHPLLKDYNPNMPFDFSLLREYPYVTTGSIDTQGLSLKIPTPFSKKFINPKTMIHTTSYSYRDQIVCNTNAFGFGFRGPNRLMEEMGIVHIPYVYDSIALFAVMPSRPMNSESRLFIRYLSNLLEKENKLMNSSLND